MRITQPIVTALVLGLLLSGCSLWGTKTADPSNTIGAPMPCDKLMDEAEKKACESAEAARKTAEANTEAFTIATEKNDPVLCAKISIKENAKACEDSVNRKKAADSGNIALCDSLDEPRKVDCVRQIYIDLAVKNKDVSYCKKIEQDVFRDGCIGTLRDMDGGLKNLPKEEKKPVETSSTRSNTGTTATRTSTNR